MTFNKKDIKTRYKNWVFIFFFESRKVMRGNLITIDEACDLLDIVSQKMQSL